MIYSAWAIYAVITDRPIDYYTYVIASYAFRHGVDPYSASDEVYNTIGTTLGLPNWGGHYVYSPLTALVVWPLTLLPPRLGATDLAAHQRLSILRSRITAWCEYPILEEKTDSGRLVGFPADIGQYESRSSVGVCLALHGRSTVLLAASQRDRRGSPTGDWGMA